MSEGVTGGPSASASRRPLAVVAPVDEHPEAADAEPTDAELLQAHADGDPAAFAALVARHQDAYVAAFRRAGTFRGDSQVTTWLHRVIVNACLDRLRRAKVRATDPLPDDVDRMPEAGDTARLDPAEAQEQREDVAEALSTLNPDQRAALVLVDMQGYPVDEAAAILGCAPGTVKSRCARGRARLVPLLAHLRELDPPPRGSPP